jgi:transcription antitermination protein NusB
MILTRRHIRIKVLQAVYAFHQSGNNNLGLGENELKVSLNKIEELYITMLSLIEELVLFFDTEMENAKAKLRPTQEELNPNKKIIENKLMQQLMTNRYYQQKKAYFKTNWSNEQDLIRKLYNLVRRSKAYTDYLATPASLKDDKEFFIDLYVEFIANNEDIEFVLEEKNIYWHDDFIIVGNAIIGTIKSFTNTTNEFSQLFPLFNKEDDKDYAFELMRKTLINTEEYETIISKHSFNWDLERVALMDIIIMKIALAELLNFPTIPSIVTLNEYIDISKEYSSPKSKMFINGVLDSILAQLTKEDKIVKTGYGLVRDKPK